MWTSSVFLLSFLIWDTLTYEQNDYNITFERLELGGYNEQYVTKFTVVNFKYNRTCTLTNATFTFLADFGNKLEVIVQAYKFMSNEYRLFPVRFQFNFCSTAGRNDFGLGKFYACGNFTRCPITKGTYHICKWAPDPSRFLPRIPNGSYKIELQVLYKNTEIMVLNAFGVVSRSLFKL